MWDIVFDLIFLQLLDMLPKPVRIGCLTILGVLLGGLLLWLWLR